MFQCLLIANCEVVIRMLFFLCYLLYVVSVKQSLLKCIFLHALDNPRLGQNENVIEVKYHASKIRYKIMVRKLLNPIFFMVTNILCEPLTSTQAEARFFFSVFLCASCRYRVFKKGVYHECNNQNPKQSDLSFTLSDPSWAVGVPYPPTNPHGNT